MAFGKLKARRFALRVQQFGASSKKPRRVKLIAQRRIFSKGKTVTSGTEVDGPGSLNAAVAKVKVASNGSKMKPGGKLAAESRPKVGNKWKKPLQNR